MPGDLGVAVPIGADADPNLVSALYFLDNGACPPPIAGAQQKLDVIRERHREAMDAPAWRRLAGAW